MKILITGGTGSVGFWLTEKLIKDNEIIIFSRNEDKQIKMKRQFLEAKYITGDVRDYQECYNATKGVDKVYHLAAMKHIGTCELEVQEAIKTNIIGTMNIVNASIVNNVKEFIMLSTDKAVKPLSLYGMTKAIAEKIVINANLHSEGNFSVLRSGNIMWSSNSVLPLFIRQIEDNNIVKVTDGSMTRFFIYLEELIYYLVNHRFDKDIFIPKMKAFQLHDLVQKIIKKYGNKDTKVEYIGKNPAEKDYELLFSKDEMQNTYELSDGYKITSIPCENLKKVNNLAYSFDYVTDDYII